MIEVRHVSYAYPETERPVLRDLSLSVPRGQVCAVVGANGAGKSTLAYLLTGFIPHFYNGELIGDEVQVAGMSLPDTPIDTIVQRVSLVSQNPFNQISGAKFTVRGELAFGLENLGVPREEIAERVEAVLRETGLAALAERSPYELSGGQQQRVAIASMLVMRPTVLVLDEPTSQLDPAGSRAVFAAIRELSRTGMTIVLVEHKLEQIAEFADRVLVMLDGRIALDGRPVEVLAAPQLEEWGVGSTRYTQVARSAAARGLWPPGAPLPVTLEGAVEGFAVLERR